MPTFKLFFLSDAAGAAGLALDRKAYVVRKRVEHELNGDLATYFPNKLHQQAINEPFKVSELEGRYDVIATITGGGVSGQAGALRLGISRALNEIDREVLRPALKRAGFLSRDARAKERKKYGLKKARKASQYSKR